MLRGWIKRPRYTSTVYTAALLGLAATLPAQAQSPVSAFVDVAVVPMDRERVLPHQTVLVQDGRITALGPVKKVRVPAEAIVIDGKGKFLIPGLTDMHVHLENQLDTTMEKGLFLFVANGVTGVRDMHSTREKGGQLPAIRTKVAARQLVGPRMYLTGDPYFEPSTPLARPGATAAALAASSTAELKTAGYDFVKMNADSGPQFDSVVAAARRVGLRMAGHAPMPLRTYGLRAALEAGYASIEHLYGYAEPLLGLPDYWDSGEEALVLLAQLNPQPEPVARALPFYREVLDTAAWMRPGYRVDAVPLHSLVTATQQAGTWNCPTLILREIEIDDARAAADSAQDSSQAGARARHLRRSRMLTRVLAVHLQIVKALYEGGAGLLAGTDVAAQWDGGVPLGFHLHRELELFVQAGLPPYAALATATRNPAEFFGVLDSAGTVAVGKRADLVLLAANPLKDIRATRNIAGVLVNGQWFSRADIDARLDRFQTFDWYRRSYDLTKVRRVQWKSGR